MVRYDTENGGEKNTSRHDKMWQCGLRNTSVIQKVLKDTLRMRIRFVLEVSQKARRQMASRYL